VLPDAIKTFFLCGIFYAAIQLNLRLFLKYRVLTLRPPAYLHYAIAGVLLLLLIIEVLNTYRKHAVMVYDFYPDRIELYGRKPATLLFAGVSDVRLKRNPLDALFRTGTLVFTPDFLVEHVEEPEQVLAYVQALVARAQGRGTGGQQASQQAAYPAQQYQQYPAYRT
jgi:hypothetical protein